MAETLSLLHYSDVLKVLEDGDLQTIGLLDYDKRLTHSFTAHPKVDPFTGTTYLPKAKFHEVQFIIFAIDL